jgi:hypothetical protein
MPPLIYSPLLTRPPSPRRAPNIRQVISPAEVTGRVLVVPHLSEVQDKVYDDPTVLVVNTVTGERRRVNANAWSGSEA